MFYFGKTLLFIATFAGAGWWFNDQVEIYQTSKANEKAKEKALLDKAQLSDFYQAELKQKSKDHEAAINLLSETIEKKNSELEWASNHVAIREAQIIKLRSENEKIDNCMEIIISPDIAP